MILWTAFISAAFLYHNKVEQDRRQGEHFGLYVCGIPVRYKNAADIFGDGTVVYDPSANMLMLNNANLDYDGSAAISEKDLTIVLNGENRIHCTGPESSAAIYASDYMLRKDISFVGSGSLTVEGDGGKYASVSGIVADSIWAYSDISITLSDVKEGSNGIECSHLALIGENQISVRVNSTGESGGIFVWGDVCLLENTTLNVTNRNAGKNAMGIECTGSFIASEGCSVNSSTGEAGAGILCHSIFFDYGATVNAVIDAVDGIRYENGNVD